MKSYKQNKIRKLFNILKSNLYLKKKVKLVFRRLNRAYGMCSISRNKKIITITLSTELSELSMIDTLIHEYAHVLMFDAGKINPDNYHCDDWGTCYSQIYRLYEKLEEIQ